MLSIVLLSSILHCFSHPLLIIPCICCTFFSFLLLFHFLNLSFFSFLLTRIPIFFAFVVLFTSILFLFLFFCAVFSLSFRLSCLLLLFAFLSSAPDSHLLSRSSLSSFAFSCRLPMSRILLPFFVPVMLLSSLCVLPSSAAAL